MNFLPCNSDIDITVGKYSKSVALFSVFPFMVQPNSRIRNQHSIFSVLFYCYSHTGRTVNNGREGLRLLPWQHACTIYRQIYRNCPQRRTPSQNGINQHTAPRNPSKRGPPLEFINIQPPQQGSASRIHQHTAPKEGVRLQNSSTST